MGWPFRLCWLVALLHFTVGGEDSNKNVLIYYSGTKNVYKKYEFHIANTECYAKRFGYKVEKYYSLSSIPRDPKEREKINGFYWKVSNLIDMLEDPAYSTRYDYIVYLDHDAGIPYNATLSIHELVRSIENAGNKEGCDIIFQDMAGAVVNAGMYIFRPTARAAQFARKWWETLESINFNHVWQQEQGIAQNTILHFIGESLNKTYGDECLNIAMQKYIDAKQSKNIDRGHIVEVASPGAKYAQSCFENILNERYLLPPLLRKCGQVCIPSCKNKSPLRFTARGKLCATDTYTNDHNWDINDFVIHSKQKRQEAIVYFRELLSDKSCS